MRNKKLGKIYFNGYFIIGFVSLVMCSCKRFVEVPPPSTQLVTASIFNNSYTATAALLNIYAEMANNGESFNLAQNTGLLSDELSNHSILTQQIRLYTNSMAATDGPGPWINAYQYIYQANAILSALENNSAIDPAIIKQLNGEAKFIRAFWNFYLVNIYGDIPLANGPDYTINAVLSRTPKSEVYAQIVTDLSGANQLLNSQYVDASDTVITTERVRPTQAAAEALLARVYLYLGKYDSAEFESSQVIANSNYSLCTNLSGPSSVFLANSSEAIWQLSTPVPNPDNTVDGENFILTGAPQSGGVNNTTTISPQLMNSFEVGDLRKTSWIGSYAMSPDTFYFPYKYQSYGASVSSPGDATEYVMVLRLAEQILIRAEARAQQGEIVGALQDLNSIRSRAGLTPYGGLTDQASLITAILHERQVELFTEWGNRWFDLIRTNSVDSLMGGSAGVCQTKGGIWAASNELYPIPKSEIGVDVHLVQNPGY
jgi:starch-binding outer membrane protein, SusD/RagB family